jgi:hypothetical protein
MLESPDYVGSIMRTLVTATEGEQGGLGTVEGAVFTLFGLIIAFAFSGAASRFNEKHMLIGDEVNAIGTAYLRLQLVPQESQQALQELLREYVDSRLETYHRLPDMGDAEQEMQNSKKLQDEIWVKAVAATQRPGSHPCSQHVVTACAKRDVRHGHYPHDGARASSS